LGFACALLAAAAFFFAACLAFAAAALAAAVFAAEAFAAVIFDFVRFGIFLPASSVGRRADNGCTGALHRRSAALRPPDRWTGVGCRGHPPIGCATRTTLTPVGWHAIFRKYNGN
jgi:hypothetical protein